VSRKKIEGGSISALIGEEISSLKRFFSIKTIKGALGNTYHIPDHMGVDHGGLNSRTFQPSNQVRDPHFGWRRIRICLPSEHRKTHSFPGQESGKRGSLETRGELDFSLKHLKFAKNPILYEVRLLWYYMENTK
jgi:hypothetical protein